MLPLLQSATDPLLPEVLWHNWANGNEKGADEPTIRREIQSSGNAQ